MVRALHRAGIEVILDIVFNHTAEGDETGPTAELPGPGQLDLLPAATRTTGAGIANFTGCGNTLNCNHPIVRTLIIDCLRYWASRCTWTGSASTSARCSAATRTAGSMENPPILERIAEDPVLRGTKIIAEAWDAAGAYQVGQFPGGRWAEWNDRFRDDLRRFWRGDPGRHGSPRHAPDRELRPVPARRPQALSFRSTS